MPQSFQEWLIEKKVAKETISEIDISYGKIEERNLIITDFFELKKIASLGGKNKFEKVTLRNLLQLTELKLWNCQIKEAEVINCPNLIRFDIRNNSLTDLYFLNNLKERLIYLDVSNNDLKSWLPFLSDFRNLESLFIGNRINGNVVSIIQKDCLNGSLEKLKELSKLKKLDISNTNINSGLEYLPTKTEKIGCSCFLNLRKCSAIKKQLKGYPLNDDKLNGEWYNFSTWRKDYQQKLLQITDEREELVQNHETVQQKGQEQLQKAIFNENYSRNQLSKVEEIVQEQQTLIQQSDFPNSISN